MGKEGKFTYDSLATAHMSDADVFQELTLKVRNSHLSHALLLELQDECRINANAADSHASSCTRTHSSKSSCSCSSSASTIYSRRVTSCSTTSATCSGRNRRRISTC